MLATCTFLGFLCLYFLYQQQTSFIALLTCYGILSCFFIGERIYRQRLARDFSNATSIAQSRVNAIANLANRGAPVLSPFVLLLFPNGLNTNYFFSFICISLMATVSFCFLSQRLAAIPQHLKNKVKAHPTFYSSEKLGLWHVSHLFLMNLVLGGLFMLLAESMLTGNSLFNFLQGPSIYFAGFWLTMLLLTLIIPATSNTPCWGLCFTVGLGLLLMLSVMGGIIAVLSLFAAGICYGLAINRLGTFIQQQLDHERYSYYETRAQTAGRIALLLSLSFTSWALNKGCAIDVLRAVMGLLVLCSAGGLMLLFIPVKNSEYPIKAILN